MQVAAEALCYCDMDRFKHMTHILLANAVKYTKRGFIKARARRPPHLDLRPC